MFVRFAFADVHAAIVAGGGFFEAGVAVQWATLEELFEPHLSFRRQVARIARDAQFIAAAVAMLMLELGEQLGVVIVRPARRLSRAVAEGAGDPHLRRNGLADELAFIGKLVQELGQLFLDLESDHGRLRRFSRHQ